MSTNGTEPSGKVKAVRMRRRGRPPTWPRIRARGPYWIVDAGVVDGKRLRRTFSAIEDAETEAARLRAEREAKHVAAKFEAENRAVSLARLTDDQRADALKALSILNGGSLGSLTAAASFFVKHAAVSNPKTVAEVSAELISSMTNANRRPRTLREIRWRMRTFGEAFGEQRIASVTTHDCETWISRQAKGGGPQTREHIRRSLSRLFRFALRRRYTDQNPVEGIDHASIDSSSAPSIHAPEEVRKVLAAAAEHAPKMVPYYAIGYFAGLRPENELRGLQWTDIDFKAGLIHVRPETAKKRRERYVDIAPNLAAWLAPHRMESGRIRYTPYSFKKVNRESGVQWSPDVMRHTFATMHFAANSDAPKTAAQLGHSGDPGVLFNHYRRLIRPDVAEAFWQIMPPAPGRVVNIAQRKKQAAG